MTSRQVVGSDRGAGGSARGVTGGERDIIDYERGTTTGPSTPKSLPQSPNPKSFLKGMTEQAEHQQQHQHQHKHQRPMPHLQQHRLVSTPQPRPQSASRVSTRNSSQGRPSMSFPSSPANPAIALSRAPKLAESSMQFKLKVGDSRNTSPSLSTSSTPLKYPEANRPASLLQFVNPNVQSPKRTLALRFENTPLKPKAVYPGDVNTRSPSILPSSRGAYGQTTSGLNNETDEIDVNSSFDHSYSLKQLDHSYHTDIHTPRRRVKLSPSAPPKIGSIGSYEHMANGSESSSNTGHKRLSFSFQEADIASVASDQTALSLLGQNPGIGSDAADEESDAKLMESVIASATTTPLVTHPHYVRSASKSATSAIRSIDAVNKMTDESLRDDRTTTSSLSLKSAVSEDDDDDAPKVPALTSNETTSVMSLMPLVPHLSNANVSTHSPAYSRASSGRRSTLPNLPGPVVMDHGHTNSGHMGQSIRAALVRILGSVSDLPTRYLPVVCYSPQLPPIQMSDFIQEKKLGTTKTHVVWRVKLQSSKLSPSDHRWAMKVSSDSAVPYERLRRCYQALRVFRLLHIFPRPIRNGIPATQVQSGNPIDLLGPCELGYWLSTTYCALSRLTGRSDPIMTAEDPRYYILLHALFHRSNELCLSYHPANWTNTSVNDVYDEGDDDKDHLCPTPKSLVCASTGHTVGSTTVSAFVHSCADRLFPDEDYDESDTETSKNSIEKSKLRLEEPSGKAKTQDSNQNGHAPHTSMEVLASHTNSQKMEEHREQSQKQASPQPMGLLGVDNPKPSRAIEAVVDPRSMDSDTLNFLTHALAALATSTCPCGFCPNEYNVSDVQSPQGEEDILYGWHPHLVRTEKTWTERSHIISLMQYCERQDLEQRSQVGHVLHSVDAYSQTKAASTTAYNPHRLVPPLSIPDEGERSILPTYDLPYSDEVKIGTSLTNPSPQPTTKGCSMNINENSEDEDDEVMPPQMPAVNQMDKVAARLGSSLQQSTPTRQFVDIQTNESDIATTPRAHQPQSPSSNTYNISTTAARASKEGPPAGPFILSQQDLWRLLNQVSSALVHLHTRGILHNDVKPANIYVSSRGDALLGDLNGRLLYRPIHQESKGFVPPHPDVVDAQVRSLEDDETSMLLLSDVEGDGRFLAPEVLSEASVKSCTRSVDVYALGLTLYQLATGELVRNSQFGSKWGVLRSIPTGSSPLMSPSSIPIPAMKLPQTSVLAVKQDDGKQSDLTEVRETPMPNQHFSAADDDRSYNQKLTSEMTNLTLELSGLEDALLNDMCGTSNQFEQLNNADAAILSEAANAATAFGTALLRSRTPNAINYRKGEYDEEGSSSDPLAIIRRYLLAHDLLRRRYYPLYSLLPDESKDSNDVNEFEKRKMSREFVDLILRMISPRCEDRPTARDLFSISLYHLRNSL